MQKGKSYFSAPLENSFQIQTFSIENQVNLFGKPLGIFAGLHYGTTTLYDPNAAVNRAAVAADANRNLDLLFLLRSRSKVVWCL